jgi:two-component system, sensor histidine kinase and response regulator
MGGELTVSSTVGQGTRFTVMLPVQTRRGLPVDSPSAGRRVAAPIPAGAPLRETVRRRLSPLEPYRVLIAEDNYANRLLLREYLNPLGVDLEEVTDGEAAVDLWWSWRPHLIWMDMRMPRMNGQTATRRIRQMEANLGIDPTVIVALTATAFEEQRQDILAAGCDEVIAKPFQTDQLLSVLQRYLAPGPNVIAEPSPAQQPEPAPHLAPDAIQAMPPTWIQALHQAACEGSDTKVMALLKEMPAAQMGVAQALSHLAKAFQFDRIIAVTLPLLPQAQSLSGGTSRWTIPSLQT